ncbi:hypothetical protein K7X08_007870 [Anisodus acutangulus]|uniref:Uncharacterized protein n=1 Tax=Anisodus acutangulus TaxID=402998 RepID=A0A9Q1RNB0_9SOLA|nr:hypothetical protein K7X08_007870 [Anisodus acutangulus]
MGLDGENDMVLPKDVEANNFVPVDVTNYEIRHQHSSRGVHGIRGYQNMCLAMIEINPTVVADKRHNGESKQQNWKDLEDNEGEETSVGNKKNNSHYSDDGLTKTGSQAQIQTHEPCFADTLAGREARELYILSQMNLSDTFDEDTLQEYFKKKGQSLRPDASTMKEGDSTKMNDLQNIHKGTLSNQGLQL